MYKPRRIETSPYWLDVDGIKIYTVSAFNRVVDHSEYIDRLSGVKREKEIPWQNTPAFTIFHDGANAQYLVLAWWGNENEMFISVSAKEGTGWIEDSDRYSFCLWDMEIMWAERNIFIETMYCQSPDLGAYRSRRLNQG